MPILKLLKIYEMISKSQKCLNAIGNIYYCHTTYIAADFGGFSLWLS